MTTEYSISVEDWRDARWEMTGREIMASLMRDDGTKQNKEITKEAKDIGCDADELIDERADDERPMMNYAYPLCGRPSDEKIAEICGNTNCTVVEDTKTGEFYLALTGGGMDLSQDIAMAYIIAEDRIPPALASEVNTQPGLSVGGENWVKVMEYCQDSLSSSSRRFKAQADEMSKVLKDYKSKKTGAKK